MLARFDQFWDLDRFLEAWSGRSAHHSMPLDAYRRGDVFYLHFDVPGVDPEAIELTVEDDVLTVKAARAWSEVKGDELVARERPQGTFERHVSLGKDLDQEYLEARLENGVLTVHMPVKAAAVPHKIPISVIEKAESL